MPVTRVRAILLAIALIASACGGSSGSVESATGEEVAATAAATAAQVNLVGGGQLDLNSLEGQDVVYWFWAPW